MRPLQWVLVFETIATTVGPTILITETCSSHMCIIYPSDVHGSPKPPFDQQGTQVSSMNNGGGVDPQSCALCMPVLQYKDATREQRVSALFCSPGMMAG